MTPLTHHIPCLICGETLTVRMARGRKSGKPFIMLVCSHDGRHFRGFITDQNYVAELLARLEGHITNGGGEQDEEVNPIPSRRSKTNLERAN